jgi:hypothetical protein
VDEVEKSVQPKDSEDQPQQVARKNRSDPHA